MAVVRGRHACTPHALRTHPPAPELLMQPHQLPRLLAADARVGVQKGGCRQNAEVGQRQQAVGEGQVRRLPAAAAGGGGGQGPHVRGRCIGGWKGQSHGAAAGDTTAAESPPPGARLGVRTTGAGSRHGRSDECQHADCGRSEDHHCIEVYSGIACPISVGLAAWRSQLARAACLSGWRRQGTVMRARPAPAKGCQPLLCGCPMTPVYSKRSHVQESQGRRGRSPCRPRAWRTRC